VFGLTFFREMSAIGGLVGELSKLRIAELGLVVPGSRTEAE